MDYGYDEATNARVQTVVDDFLLRVAEREYLDENGYSLRSEIFANFMISNSPDGVGLFTFEEGSPLEVWQFSKVAGLVSFEGQPADLYQAIDQLIVSNEERSLTLMTIPFASHGGLNREATEAVVYHIQGTEIRPFTNEELAGVASTLTQFTVNLKPAPPWEYHPYEKYMKLEV